MSRRAALLGFALLLACDAGDDDDDDSSGGSSDGAAIDCEDGPVITYDTFGRGFLAAYCNGCHGSQVVDRKGAPATIVLDDRDSVTMLTERIFARVLPPGGAPPTMPPAGGITNDDRERLRVWLTCWP
ncbi:MAG: hypothetical protein IAG13_22410 [Deltaproteobacteria bacterium]|nr:hypothetical protein [Nannocystaceae bacterium]